MQRPKQKQNMRDITREIATEATTADSTQPTITTVGNKVITCHGTVCTEAELTTGYTTTSCRRRTCTAGMFGNSLGNSPV